ncbi:MAG: class I SAM-dependent methyltransferase [Candidatus Nucleicultricaceae bacterium]
MKLTEYSEAFLDFAPKAPGPVLDIGAAFGVASLPALERGAEVIINDMAQEHLDAIAEHMPENLKSRVHYCCGRIPDEISLAPESLGAIHSSQVFHFLTGFELTKTFKLMYSWLKPEGKIFIIASSPYIRILENYLQEYALKKGEGMLWPGEVDNLKEITNHPVIEDNPPFFNFLDDDVLRRIARETGFTIEKISLFDRDELPDHIKLDGRENVGLIAQKPSR